MYASAAALKISPGTVLCFGHVPVEKASIHKSISFSSKQKISEAVMSWFFEDRFVKRSA